MTYEEAIDVVRVIQTQVAETLERSARDREVAYVSRLRLARWRDDLAAALATLGEGKRERP